MVQLDEKVQLNHLFYPQNSTKHEKVFHSDMRNAKSTLYLGVKQFLRKFVYIADIGMGFALIKSIEYMWQGGSCMGG